MAALGGGAGVGEVGQERALLLVAGRGGVPGGSDDGGRDELDESRASRASSSSTRARSATTSAHSAARRAFAAASVPAVGGPVSTAGSLARPLIVNSPQQGEVIAYLLRWTRGVVPSRPDPNAVVG